MVAMADVVRTDELAPADVDAIRRLLDAAFAGRFEETDWDHALGGQHVIVREAGEIVAHGAVVARTIWIGVDEHEVGYVEAVATAPGSQGRGHGTTVMRAIADEIASRHRVGVLSTGESHFYERLGWQRWLGPTSVRSSTGDLVRTPDEDDGIMVLAPAGIVDRRAAITCAERAGDDW